jgi:3-oxo-5-alpha-steroid 4-dehydrogenase 1
LTQNLFYCLVAAQALAGVGALVALIFVSAPYGKHSRPGWGPQMNSRLAWMLMETPAVLAPAAIFLATGNWSSGAVFALCLWEMHYLYRSYVYSALQRGSKRSFPIALAALAFVFNINNGVIIGYDLFARGRAGSMALWSLPGCIGLALFLAGFALHVVSDASIRSLRGEGEKGYKIPRGGLFRLVSDPNYLGEIVQWMGLALMTRSVAVWAFAFFTFCNVFPRAISNHRWYHEHFPDYPPERRIIIPFLF